MAKRSAVRFLEQSPLTIIMSPEHKLVIKK